MQPSARRRPDSIQDEYEHDAEPMHYALVSLQCFYITLAEWLGRCFETGILRTQQMAVIRTKQTKYPKRFLVHAAHKSVGTLGYQVCTVLAKVLQRNSNWDMNCKSVTNKGKMSGKT